MTALELLQSYASGPELALGVGAIVLLSGGLAMRRQKKGATAKRTVNKIVPSKPQARLPIETDDPDRNERRAVAQYIAGLMVADEWTAIGDQLVDWEASLATSPAGQRFHDIGAKVALSGLQNLVDEAPRDTLADLAEAETELAHFMDTYRGARDNHVLSLLAARAQLIVGEACSADHWPDESRKDAWRKMAHHYVKAGEILTDFDALTQMSPLLAEAHYLQALGSPGSAHKLPELFEAWINLDPANPSIYAAHAAYLSDPENVSDNEIRAMAEEACARTEDSMGFGGYALFFLALMDHREGVQDLIDFELFGTAMMDLASISANQSEANWAAGRLAEVMNAIEDETQAQVLQDTLYMLIQSSVSVIYPRLWPMDQEEVEAIVAQAGELPELLVDAGFEGNSNKYAAAA